MEDLVSLSASVDSGISGRSSNFQLPIHSVELGSDNVSTSSGIWMAPEYSGIWRMDAFSIAAVGGTRFYWSLPSLLFTMGQGESLRLPAAVVGQWTAKGGSSDWSNAVRAAIGRDFSPRMGGGRGDSVQPLTLYQGLGALPAYQTEDVLYETTRRVQAIGVEAFVFDAGTYTRLAAVCALFIVFAYCVQSCTTAQSYTRLRPPMPNGSKRCTTQKSHTITHNSILKHLTVWHPLPQLSTRLRLQRLGCVRGQVLHAAGRLVA